MDKHTPTMRNTPCSICYVCGFEGNTIYKHMPDRLFGLQGEWNVRQCRNPGCGSTWLDPMPSKEDLHMAYSSYYTHGNSLSGSAKGRKPINLRGLARKLERIWLFLLFQASERKAVEYMYLDGYMPGRLLEVGCGDGSRLAMMQKLGWTVEAQDIDEKAVNNVRQTYGFNVHSRDLGELKLPKESYDAIIMNHVIEHLTDPVAMLQECRRLLRPDGVFVATTPNPKSYGHGKFGSFWIGLDVPRHLHLFTSPALEKIADTAGFSQQRSWTSAARAGGLLAASSELKKSGGHTMRGQVKIGLMVTAMLYQLMARIAYLIRKDSGEEVVLMAIK